MDPGSVQTLDERFDFRFEIVANDEPSCNADLYFIAMFEMFDGEDTGTVERWTCEDPGAAVEAAREAQMYTFEERMDMYAERGW